MARVSYVLGIDVGRARGAAAVCRRGVAGFGRAEPVPLDGGARWFPSVLFVAADGEVVLGRAALRRAEAEPDRLARAAVDRVGDDTAVLLGGELYPAETLVAALVAWIADTVAAAEGADPDRIAVTHPPEWGPYRRRLLHDALHEAGLPGALLLPTVVAAAEARHDRDPVPTGAALVVALVGATHSEQAVLYRGPSAFDLTAHTPHPTTAAGDHLDDLLADHVLAATPTPGPDETVPDLRTAGPIKAADVPRPAMATFREACTAAKERLSVAPEARVPLPHTAGDVTVTRATFTELARPTLSAIADQIRSLLATVPPDHLAGAILAGGTARIPLLADLAGCPAEEDPATAPARGAALAARPLGSHAGRGPHPSHPRLTPVGPGSNPGFAPVGPGSNPGFTPVGPGSNPGFTPVGPGSNPGFTPVGPGSSPGFAPAAAGLPAKNNSAPGGPHSNPRLSPAPPGHPNLPGPLSHSGLVPVTAPTPGAQRADGLVLPARSLSAHLGADPLLAPRPIPAPPPARHTPPPQVPAEPVEHPVDVDSTLDSDPPPPRPPVELTPLVPPAPRFAFPRRRRDEDEADR